MKAKDLMIGDWVCYSEPNNYYTKVKEIRCTSDGEEYYIRCHRDSKDTFLEQLKYEDFSVDILHPILLSPEILEKNGWVKNLYSDESYFNEELECLPFVVGVDGNKWWWHVGAELVTPINYVHELQHALRLCGIKKEIIL